MDTNGLPIEGTSNPGFPLGMGAILNLNDSPRDLNHTMSEAEKEHIIMQCRDAKSRKEAQRIVNERVPDQNVNSLYEEPRVN
jgi:hypothetical protein